MSAWYIRTRQEFFEVLARTHAVAERRSAASPLPFHGGIVAQLEAMATWTRDGRAPSEEERDRITIGLIAVRELEAQASDEEADFAECLMQLAGYFEEWPNDEPSTATDQASPTASGR